MAKKPVHAAIVTTFLFIGVWISTLEARGADEAVLQPLTSALAIHSLGSDAAGRRLPVLLRCVVTYTDPVRSMLFVRDESGGVYVDINAPYHYELEFGQEVEVAGVTTPGFFAPMVAEPKIRIIGRGVLPRPKPVSIQTLLSGAEDCEWVEVRGVVRSTGVADGIFRMTVVEGNARIEAQIRDTAGMVPLVDSLVTLQGVSGGLFNNKGQLIGDELYLPGMAQVRVNEPGPSDPFSIELRSVQHILRFITVRGYGHRVRLRGTVTYHHPGAFFFLRDGTGSIYVVTPQRDALVPGDTVDVVGFPEAGDYTPILRDATYRKTGSGPAPVPTKVRPEVAVNGAYDTELVEIEARFVSAGRVSGEYIYVLRSGYVTFNAHLQAAEGAEPKLPLTPGALLRLTGICSVDADELRRPRAFRILVRSAGDIVLLEKPSWWTLRRTLVVVGTLVVVVLAVLSWVFILDRRIKAQTAIIRQRLEREAALEHQLQQSQKMEAIGRLAGGIAHDFNNLLTAILGYTELIALQFPPQHQVIEEVAEIRKAGERASALTRQLLAFSRRQVLQPKVLDLNVVIREMAKMVQRLIGEHIELVIVLEPRLGALKADRSQIEQVLLNLAVNARDAMPGGGKLIVQTRNEELLLPQAEGEARLQPGPYVRLSVTDTGCGMDEMTQKSIFEPFFTTKEVGQGTGLGLATVYGIVKQSGGEILVESRVGEGTAFEIYLPRVMDATEVEPPAESHVAATGKERILVVEDEDALRALVRLVLTRHGYEVVEARNGEEALEIATSSDARIHLLVSDVVMPRMGGIELASRLSPLKPDVKVLFVSGYADHDVSSQDVIKGGAPFLQKPFTPDALARKVREVLDAGAGSERGQKEATEPAAAAASSGTPRS